jgi:large subunit ribosomal protein L18
MGKVMQKIASRLLRKNRVRATVIGTAERPRLSVYLSNMHVHAQIIDDATGKTLASTTTATTKDAKGSMSEKAAWAGKDIAAKAKKANITKVVFDRNGRKYHGRLKSLADAAREGGLEF